MQSLLWTIALVILSATGYAQGSIGNIVVNGSFEDLADFTFAPWIGGGIFVVNEPGRAASGGNFAQPGNDLWQDMTTTPGTVYQLRFAFGGNNARQLNREPMTVRWGNTDVATFPIEPVANPEWNYYTYTVEATAPTTRLRFVTTGFPYIDDVSVVLIPEPKPSHFLALGILCLGILCLGILRNRRVNHQAACCSWGKR